MPMYRVTMMVEMDVEADDSDLAFDYAHHEATHNADFTCVESFEPEELLAVAEDK